MLCKFPKFSQLIYSSILLILILGTKFADPTPTEKDKKFIKLCNEMYKKIETKLNQTPLTIFPIKNYHDQPWVTSKEDFSSFILEKIELLAEVFGKIQEKINNEEKSLFDLAIDKFETAIMNAEKDGGKYGWILKNALDGNKRHFFNYILQEYPSSFFISFLDELLWKPDEAGSANANHSVEIKKEKLRKKMNEFIKVLKIEIVYGQSVGAINQIKVRYSNFKEQFNGIKKFKKSDNLEMILNNPKTNLDIKFKEIEIAEKKSPESKAYFFYNLLNNTTNMVCENLEQLVGEAIDLHDSVNNMEARKEMPTATWALVELIMKPILHLVLNEAIEALSSNKSKSAKNFVETLERKQVNAESEPNSSSRSSRNNKKGKGIVDSKFEYYLEEKIKEKLQLENNYLTLEGLLVKKSINKANYNNQENIEVVKRESNIRIAAAKLLLAYERLKAMYYVRRELNADELKNAEELAYNLITNFLMIDK